MKLDLVVFAVHPDDVELSCGGILPVEKEGQIYRNCRLTKGELGTQVIAETRKAEAAVAARILQLEPGKT
jgi:LmbE family N-acetylglucosaminyl deacetylase